MRVQILKLQAVLQVHLRIHLLIIIQAPAVVQHMELHLQASLYIQLQEQEACLVVPHPAALQQQALPLQAAQAHPAVPAQAAALVRLVVPAQAARAHSTIH